MNFYDHGYQEKEFSISISILLEIEKWELLDKIVNRKDTSKPILLLS